MDTKTEFFDVASRVREPVPEGVPQGAVPWAHWNVWESGLSPREAKTRMVEHVAYWIAEGWEVVGLNRAEITLENEDGKRCAFRVRKEG